MIDGESQSEPTREELIALIRAQAAEIAALKARVAELERRLGLNSTNSGKPPSSDGLKKPPRTRSLREPSNRKPGGQKGHKGETLRQVAKPDTVIDHFPFSCADCSEELIPAMSTGYSARQVFDLPEPPPPVVTEHRAHVCACPHCGTKTSASFPEGINAPVQYGPRIMAIVVYLLHYQLLPEDRLAELMAALLGVKLVPATIARMSRSCAARLQDFVATLGNLVAGAAVKHMDETGFRIGGKTQWLHVASTTLLTFYRVCAKRGSMMVVVSGVIVHDHFASYYQMATGVLHALCNAHHLRELKALIEIEKEDWARKMHQLLRRACHAVNLARERDGPLEPRLIELINRRYDAIVAEGMAFHEAQSPLEPATTPEGQPKKRGRKRRRTGHNLLLRLATRKQDVLRFLIDPRVPFTNNEAERDGRMMKVKQKISGGFRSLEGATNFAIIRSAIGTALKQGWNVIQVLSQDSKTLVAKLQAG
jgi:transposase